MEGAAAPSLLSRLADGIIRHPFLQPAIPLMKSRVLLAVLPLAAVLAACDTPSGPGVIDGGESELFVSYSGPETGSLRAEGEPDLDRDPNLQTFASGGVVGGGLYLQAYHQRGNGRYDFVNVIVPAAAVGEYAVERNCGGLVCTEVNVALDMGQANGSPAAHSCHLDQGTIRVTSVSAARAAGTFSGTGWCVTGGGTASVLFQVTHGSFDVELLQR